MRFCALGSGSRGNCLLVQTSQTCVMVDNGFSIRETERRLADKGINPGQINAILVTHEHSDHINGVGAFARKYSIDVYATRGTLSSHKLGDLPRANTINSHKVFAIDDMIIDPFPVPHDAVEPCQFVFGDGRRRFALLTDTGNCTAHIEQQISGCDALMLECNHDLTLLEQGDYPYNVKVRVAGDYGHLNNCQAANLLTRIDTTSLQHLVAAHISEKHNTPQLARHTLSAALGCPQDWIAVADQQSGIDWCELS